MARASEREKQLELQLMEQKNEMETVQKFVVLAMRALALRMLATGALIGDFIFFGWFMWAGGWERLAAAILFAVASWAVLNLKYPKEANTS